MSINIEGKSRISNPTPVSNNNTVDAMFDDVGRQIMQPMHVRDMIATAYASTATLAAVDLRTAIVGEFLDLVQITAANQTAAAILLDIRDVSAGNVVASLNITASGTETITFPTPYPQGSVGNTWTIQNGGSGDISNTVVDVTALFVRNV